MIIKDLLQLVLLADKDFFIKHSQGKILLIYFWSHWDYSFLMNTVVEPA